MTLTATWAVTFGQKSTTVDLTDRVVGMRVQQQLRLAQLGVGRAFVTLNNNDGALTPRNGGTYTSTDWFSYYMRVSCTISNGSSSYTARLFDGMVSDFTVDDDGQNSYVTISADDFMTVAGRSPVVAAATDILAPFGATQAISSVLATQDYPALGGTDPVTIVVGLRGSRARSMVVKTQNTVTAQAINDQVLPAGPIIAWGSKLVFAGEPGAVYDPDYRIVVVDVPYNPNSANDYVYEFDDTPTGTQLVANQVDAGWNIDEVRNSATVQSNVGFAPQTVNSAPSIDKYGKTAVSFTFVASNSAALTLEDATEWANRWDTPVYAARTLRTSFKTIEAKADDAAYERFGQLLDVEDGLFRQANVMYTPTGGSSGITDVCVIFGRTIEWTPRDTRITLRLVPASSYRSFALDSTTLGILGGTVQEYDDTGDPDTYDSFVSYDGETIQGFRLG
jgi:hypothetical protein